MEVRMIATALDRLPPSPWASLFGWRLIDARPQEGWIRVGFDGKAEFCNAAGFVQGGILSAMLDGTMGAAVIVMSDGKFYDPTISMMVNFMARAKTGPITGEAKVTQLGKSIAFVEGRLTADDGTLLATASASTRLVEAAKAIR
jgi:uncharacterized protein (TIGR00369 family)